MAPAVAVNAPDEKSPGEFATAKATPQDLAAGLATFGARFFTNAAFDGDWHDAERGLAFLVAGNTGIATAAFGSAAKPGDALDATLQARCEQVVARGWFYAGPWLEAGGSTGHGIAGLAATLSRAR